MNRTTGADDTAFSIACLVSVERNLEAMRGAVANLKARDEAAGCAGRAAWRKADDNTGLANIL